MVFLVIADKQVEMEEKLNPVLDGRYCKWRCPADIWKYRIAVEVSSQNKSYGFEV